MERYLPGFVPYRLFASKEKTDEEDFLRLGCAGYDRDRGARGSRRQADDEWRDERKHAPSHASPSPPSSPSHDEKRRHVRKVSQLGRFLWERNFEDRFIWWTLLATEARIAGWQIQLWGAAARLFLRTAARTS